MSFDKDWVTTEEGNREFIFWLCDLTEKASKDVNIPMEVDKFGSVLVTITLEDNDYPKSLRKLKDFNKLPKNTKVAIEVRDPILEMITNLATARQNAVSQNIELAYSDEELFSRIEELVIQYLMRCAQKAKSSAIEQLKEIKNFKIEKTDFGYNIVPIGEDTADGKFGNKLKKVFKKIKKFFVDYSVEIFCSIYVLIYAFLIIQIIQILFV